MISRLLQIVSCIFVVTQTALFPHGYQVLEPLSDGDWLLGSLKRRTSGSSSVALQDHEHFVWGPSSGSDSIVYANMTLSTGDDELVLSMERFASELSNVKCDSQIEMIFKSNATFGQAIASWSWVNFKDQRTFIMIANYPGCGPANTRQPWVVSNVNYDSKYYIAYLNATQKSWKDIAHTYVLDFGKYGPQTPAKGRRDLIDYTQSFSIDLAHSLPQEVFAKENFGQFSFGIDCEDCGSKGSLELQGHIESNLWGLDVFTISAIPHGISAALTLKLMAAGALAPGGWSKQFHILTVDIPGLGIPDVLDIGPNLEFDGGFALSKLTGDVVITSGVTASIPDTSLAEIDFVAKKNLDFHGWKPTFSTVPFKVDVQVDATIELFIQLSVAFSLDCLGTGFDADLGLKVPDIKVELAGTYDEKGVCAGSKDPYGLSIDATAGASLLIQAYDEVAGNRDYFVNQPLFDDGVAYTFPSLCLPFGTPFTTTAKIVSVTPTPVKTTSTPPAESSTSSAPDAGPSGDTCPLYTPDTGDETDYVDTESDSGVAKVKRTGPLLPRSTRTPYYMSCDSGKTHPIQLKDYFTPGGYIAATKSGAKGVTAGSVPFYRPGIKPKACVCPEPDWEVTEEGDDAYDNVVYANGTRMPPDRYWASEHIYEGVWIKNFLDGLTTKYKQCDDLTNIFLTIKPDLNLGATITNVQPATYADALMMQLATEFTTSDRMVVLSPDENGKKSLIFQGNDLYSRYTNGKLSLNDQVCALGHIVAVCRYLEFPKVQSRLNTIVTGIEDVLTKLNADPRLQNITAHWPTKPDFLEDHRRFFGTFFNTGMDYVVKKLKAYAAQTQGTVAYQRTPIGDPMRTAVDNVASGAASYCQNKRVYTGPAL